MHQAERAKPCRSFVWGLQSVRGLAAWVVSGYRARTTLALQGDRERIYCGFDRLFCGPGAVNIFSFGRRPPTDE